MNNFKKKIFDGFYADVWHRLKNTNKPILIYGMGNGADKIIKVLEETRNKIESVMDEEQDCFDNLPEGFQQATRGQQMEEAIGSLSAAIDSIDEAIGAIEEAQM